MTRFAPFLAALLAACAASAASVREIEFAENTEPFVNPCQGWTIFNDPDVTNYVNCGAWYARDEWCKFEPQEGVYDWSLLEERIARAQSLGIPLNFRIMAAAYHSGSYSQSPMWLYDKGCRWFEFRGTKCYRPEKGRDPNIHRAPEFGDPVMIAAHRRFIEALAKRYDGDPRIGVIDIGSYGNWGEWHCYMLNDPKKDPPMTHSWEIRKQYADMYLDNFKKTPLVMMWGNGEAFKYALGADPANPRTGLRSDSLGPPHYFPRWEGKVAPWSEIRNLHDIWRTKPVMVETCGRALDWKKDGYDLDYCFQWLMDSHVLALNVGPFGPKEYMKAHPEDAHFRETVRKVDLYAGARLVPERASVSADGRRVRVSLHGVNKGVAKIYHDFALVWTVRAADGEEIFRKASSADVRGWLPGPFSAADSFELPDAPPPGCRLEARILHAPGALRDFRFAALRLTPGGALDLGPLLD